MLSERCSEPVEIESLDLESEERKEILVDFTIARSSH